jgi:hypothetical protein
LLEEIQETSLMLNLYEQQRLRKSKEITHLQELQQTGSTVDEDGKGKIKSVSSKETNGESHSVSNNSNGSQSQENNGGCSQSQSDVESDEEHNCGSENDEVASFADEEDQRIISSQAVSSIVKSADESRNDKVLVPVHLSSVSKRPNTGDIVYSSDQEGRDYGIIRSKPSKQPKCGLYAQI